MLIEKEEKLSERREKYVRLCFIIRFCVHDAVCVLGLAVFVYRVGLISFYVYVFVS